jgi:predicted MFS family arabinose efflux permease
MVEVTADRGRQGSRYGAALRSPVAARLLTAQSINELGDFIGITALVLLAYAHTGSVLGAGAVYAANALLKVATASWGATFLDGVPRRVALAGLALAGALVMGSVALFPNFAVALLAAALLGGCRTAFVGVEAALLGEAVSGELRGPVLALNGTINQIAQVAGIVGGAAVTLTLGVRTALLIDVVTFVVAALVLLTLPRTPQRKATARPRPLDGVRAVLAQPTLRTLAPVAWMCMVASLLPETLAADAVSEAWVPAAMAASPLGGSVGYLLAGRTTLLDSVPGIFRAQVTLGTVLVAGALAGWLAPSGPTFVVVNFCVGVAAVAMLGVRGAFIQHSPPEQAVQINSTMVASVGVLEGAGAVLAGGVAAAVSVPVAYLLIGCLILAMSLTALRGIQASGVPQPA